MGQFGSGFLSDPATLKEMMAARQVRLIPSAALLPKGSTDLIISGFSSSKNFPQQLGPFALVPAPNLSLCLDLEAGRWTASCEHSEEVPQGLERSSSITSPFCITLGSSARTKAGIPEDAHYCAWAYGCGLGRLTTRAQAYFSTTSSTAAFLVNGGFVYLGKDHEIVGVPPSSRPASLSPLLSALPQAVAWCGGHRAQRPKAVNRAPISGLFSKFGFSPETLFSDVVV